MKTVIISIDFSETSLNAARYAAQMFSDKPSTHLILYHMYEKEEDYETARKYLDSLREEMEWTGDKDAETMLEQGDNLIDSLERLAYQKSATLIIMGITGKSQIRRALIGSNTLEIAERDVCPVLIIPPDARYNGINNVALASEFKNVEDNTPVYHISSVLEMFNASLHIVNVDSEIHVSLTEEKRSQREIMSRLFEKFTPEFYFIGTSEFVDTIEQFADDHKIDLIITVHHYHSFFGKVFGASNTKKLAYHSKIPVMAAYP